MADLLFSAAQAWHGPPMEPAPEGSVGAPCRPAAPADFIMRRHAWPRRATYIGAQVRRRQFHSRDISPRGFNSHAVPFPWPSMLEHYLMLP